MPDGFSPATRQPVSPFTAGLAGALQQGAGVGQSILPYLLTERRRQAAGLLRQKIAEATVAGAVDVEGLKLLTKWGAAPPETPVGRAPGALPGVAGAVGRPGIQQALQEILTRAQPVREAELGVGIEKEIAEIGKKRAETRKALAQATSKTEAEYLQQIENLPPESRPPQETINKVTAAFRRAVEIERRTRLGVSRRGITPEWRMKVERLKIHGRRAVGLAKDQRLIDLLKANALIGVGKGSDEEAQVNKLYGDLTTFNNSVHEDLSKEMDRLVGEEGLVGETEEISADEAYFLRKYGTAAPSK